MSHARSSPQQETVLRTAPAAGVNIMSGCIIKDKDVREVSDDLFIHDNVDVESHKIKASSIVENSSYLKYLSIH